MRSLWMISLLFSATSLASGPTVLVVPVGPPSPSLSRAMTRLVHELGAGGEISVSTVPAGDASRIASEVSGLLQRAKETSRRFAEQEALELLEQAERLIRDKIALLISVQPLVDVLLARAKLEGELGHGRRARKTLGQVVTLAPHLTLDPGAFPPDMQRMYRELKDELRSAATATLLLKSAPVGLRVFVDGIARGRTPLQVQLPPGPHLVAMGESGSSSASLLELEVGGRRELALAVPGMARDDSALRDVGRLRGVQWVLALRLRGAGPSRRVVLRLVPVAAGLSTRLVQGEAGVEFLASVDILAARVPAAMNDEEPSAAGRGGTSIFRRWWFWTAVGVVALGAGSTAAVLSARDDPGVHLRLVP